MRNLNTENAALLTEVRKNEMRNPPFTNTTFPAIFVELANNMSLCQLSDEELALSDVTLERIGATEQLHEFMLKCQKAYTAMHSMHAAPEWLRESGENDAHFATFFSNLNTIEQDADVMEVLGAMKTLSPADAKTLYTHYQELRTGEKTRQAAVRKIQLAYDLSGLLRRILAFNGYTGTEIDAVVGAI